MNTTNRTAIRQPFDIGYFIRSFLVLILLFIVFAILWLGVASQSNALAGTITVLIIIGWLVAIDIYFKPKDILRKSPTKSSLPEPGFPCLDILFRYWRPKFYQAFVDQYQANLFRKYYEEALYAATHDTFTTDHLLSMLRVRPDARTEVVLVLQSLLGHTHDILTLLKSEFGEHAKKAFALLQAEDAMVTCSIDEDQINTIRTIATPINKDYRASVEEIEIQSECLENIERAIINAHISDMTDTKAYMEGLFPDN